MDVLLTVVKKSLSTTKPADRSGLSGLAPLERHSSFLNASTLLNNVFMLLLITHIY